MRAKRHRAEKRQRSFCNCRKRRLQQRILQPADEYVMDKVYPVSIRGQAVPYSDSPSREAHEQKLDAAQDSTKLESASNLVAGSATCGGRVQQGAVVAVRPYADD